MKRMEEDLYPFSNVAVFKDMRQVVKEKAFFLHKFARNPKSIGSITPSSAFLVQSMLSPICWENTNTIIELGAGTGVVTRSIQERKRPEAQALIFELDQTMRQRLVDWDPGLTIHSNAADLFFVMQEMGIAEADCVISGLPFANFDQTLRNRILEGVIRSLKPGGIFVAFQYSLQMKKQFEARFEQVEIKFVPRNVPPAFVYYCYK